MNCRICGNNLQPFMTFGKMPIANGFLQKEEIGKEYFFKLSPTFCSKCFTFQIEEQPDAGVMFHENYAFFTRQSKKMQNHFKEFAQWIDENFMKSENPFIIELGSNDGVLLEHFAKKGVNHLGVEPSANVALEAEKYGVKSLVKFFSEMEAKNILESHGKVDVITDSNVICHIPDLNDIARGINLLLKEKGVLIFEDPYLGEMINKTSYDQIYDEHVYIFSALSVKNIFSKVGLELIDCIPQNTHGGSMRYIFSRVGEYNISKNVERIIKQEEKDGLNKIETFINFKKNCENSRDDLIKILKKEKALGKKIAAYGATSKSTTILNYCNIGPEVIEYISDTTPIKQNKVSPGMHIPVKPYEEFQKNPPDIAVLFAWNHSEEIFAKENVFVDNGGKWIIHVPKVRII